MHEMLHCNVARMTHKNYGLCKCYIMIQLWSFKNDENVMWGEGFARMDAYRMLLCDVVKGFHRNDGLWKYYPGKLYKNSGVWTCCTAIWPVGLKRMMLYEHVTQWCCWEALQEWKESKCYTVMWLEGIHTGTEAYENITLSWGENASQEQSCMNMLHRLEAS